MKKRALLIGINYTNTHYQLNGCVNDVLLMQQILSQNFNFDEIQLLTNNAATLDNCYNKIKWLISNSSTEDVSYLHYSGHGLDIFNTKKFKDLDSIIVGTLENVVMFFDCCYSNSSTNDIKTIVPVNFIEQNSILTFLFKNCIIINGCNSNQKSLDLWLYDKFIGSATYFLVQNLKKYNWNISYGLLVSDINRDLKKHKCNQTVELLSDIHHSRKKFLEI